MFSAAMNFKMINTTPSGDARGPLEFSRADEVMNKQTVEQLTWGGTGTLRAVWIRKTIQLQNPQAQLEGPQTTQFCPVHGLDRSPARGQTDSAAGSCGISHRAHTPPCLPHSCTVAQQWCPACQFLTPISATSPLAVFLRTCSLLKGDFTC